MVSINLKLDKIKSLQKFLKNQKINLALLEKIDAKYFSGINADLILIIPASSKPKIYISPLEIDNYKKDKNYQLLPFSKSIKLELKDKVVGMNYAITTMKTALNIKSRKKDISDFISKLRQVKTKQEIATIKKACNISCEIIEKTIKKINKTLFTEKEIRIFLEKETIINGCSLAFHPIVASGKNAAIPHAKITDKLNKGFLIIDFGVKYKGYCSDISRTIYIGKPTQKEIELYNLVLRVQENSIKQVKNFINRKVSLLDDYSRKEFGKYKDKFIHSLGHGFGLEIHEQPFLSKNSDDILLHNQIITIEPGFYDLKQKIGIRIEDDILIKENFIEVLTKNLSKKLIVVN